MLTSQTGVGRTTFETLLDSYLILILLPAFLAYFWQNSCMHGSASQSKRLRCFLVQGWSVLSSLDERENIVSTLVFLDPWGTLGPR